MCNGGPMGEGHVGKPKVATWPPMSGQKFWIEVEHPTEIKLSTKNQAPSHLTNMPCNVT